MQLLTKVVVHNVWLASVERLFNLHILPLITLLQPI